MVLGGLLDACVENLHDQGMKSMFIDGIGEEANALLKLGMWQKPMMTSEALIPNRFSTMGPI